MQRSLLIYPAAAVISLGVSLSTSAQESIITTPITPRLDTTFCSAEESQDALAEWTGFIPLSPSKTEVLFLNATAQVGGNRLHNASISLG